MVSNWRVIRAYPVVWDFRSADVALGGHGAPLAPFFHFACAKYVGVSDPIAFLNLGGVGNITYVDPRLDDVTDLGAVLAFDTGPANAPLNDFMMVRSGHAYDAHGALAATGTPDMDVVRAFLNTPYFRKLPPKSLDRNSFPQIAELVAHIE
jgi:anhydro-N-acetylmuramic acid kinase